MTISAPVRRRWPIAAAAAIAGLIVGLVIGLAASDGGDSDPVEAARDAREKVQRAATVLDVVPIEYGETTSGTASREEGLRGATGAVDRSRAIYVEARPALAELDPARATDIDHRYTRLKTAIDQQRALAVVRREADALRKLLGARTTRP